MNSIALALFRPGAQPLRLATAFALALTMTLISGSPASAAQGLDLNDVARLRQVRSAVISPDGQHVAFLQDRPRKPWEEDDGPSWMELYVADAQGEVRSFITGEVSIGGISWTPDGKGIAYITKREGDEKSSLYVIAADGGEGRRIVEHGAAIEEYSFSPDGKTVAFLAEEPESKEAKKVKEKGFKQVIYEEDGKPTRVWVAELSGDGEPRRLEVEGSASKLHWSPMAARLAVALKPLPLIDLDYTSLKVHVLDAATGKVLARFDNPGKLGQVEWSPDGLRLALTTALDANDPSPGRLAVVNAEGGELNYLVGGDFPGDVAHFAWAGPDRLLALVSRRSEIGVAQVSLEGNVQWLIEPGQACWDDLAVAADGSTVSLVGDTATHTAELFFGKVDGELHKVTDSNPWLAERSLSRQELITYQARDGESVEAILNYPLADAAGKRVPLIVSVHGGPESFTCNGWTTGYSTPTQVAAAHGFAVLAPNYRGSTGRGVAFAKAHQADPGGKEFDDLVDGVDALIAKGLVDGKKVGITGGSYGGFATAWGATYYSERYAAAVMFVGISDQISKFGTTDIPEESYLVHQRKRLWDEWQFFLERSPIYYTDRARTPILILHGQDDPRVNPGQSMELYRHLKTRGQVPVRYVQYPGEGHGNRKAAARYDYSLRMLQWFEHYLQGEGGQPPPYELDYQKALGLDDKKEDGPSDEDGGT